ncbi:MAG: hypothetical protein PVG07_14865, partial [Acidobacteriota bacterium]
MRHELPLRRPIDRRRRHSVPRTLRLVGLVLGLTGVLGPAGRTHAAPLPEDPAPRSALTGRWMGRTEAFGYPLLVECRFDGRGGGTLRGFAAAPMGFDALTLPPVPVSGATLRGNELRFEAAGRGRTVLFEAGLAEGAGGAEEAGVVEEAGSAGAAGPRRAHGTAGTADRT